MLSALSASIASSFRLGPRRAPMIKPVINVLVGDDFCGGGFDAGTQRLKHGFSKARTIEESTRGDAEKGDTSFRRISTFDRILVEEFFKLPGLTLKRRDQNVFFAGEACIESSKSHPRTLRDIAQADVLKTSFLGQLDGCVDDSFCALAHRSYLCVNTCVTSEARQHG